MKTSIKLLALILSVSFTACLKDKPLFDPDMIPNVLELENIGPVESTTASPYPLFSKSFDIAPESNLELTVNYAGDEVAPQDITVQLAVDPGVLKAYNDTAHTTYTILPTTLYTLPTTVTIPKGQRKGRFVVKLKTEQFDFTKTYALPVAIQSTNFGVISGNFGKVVYKVGAKNKFDGVYSLKSRMGANADRPTFARSSWTWPYDVQLVTTGPNSVALFNSQYSNDYTHPIVLNDNSVSRLGTFTPEFTFDASNKLVSVKNYIVNPANGRAARMNTAVPDSRYDPATKTAYLSFLMEQPAFEPLSFTDTLVYKRSR
ncbi:DUF1735 domain-containing protein [Segetibacter sp. 3557_3]|uniref:DUF1735 domain-containing protein n=1 Tax=Segetibacter sp. 3557_3 TaxID=2547429 RepID=UPI0010592155|nr:DUF1735 domain-containing protein [Segetibacter sp. 3557_3]TDH21307.1 DUF1735 domain-containing protein [Segetibacter sp. 3557_3]